MPIPENVQYIRLPSPISISLKAISEPESLISISPFSVNIMFISVRSIIHPTTSPDCHCLPKDSIPICQRWAWKRKHFHSRFWIAASLGFSQAHNKILVLPWSHWRHTPTHLLQVLCLHEHSAWPSQLSSLQLLQLQTQSTISPG